MLAAVPRQGGASWAVLQYILGFKRLGHDVLFVEPIGAEVPAATAYFARIVNRWGLSDRAALLPGETRKTIGLAYDAVRRISRSADVLVNLSGTLAREEFVEPIPTRLYLDLDPGFTQLWTTQGVDMRLAGHTHFATVGQKIGLPTCTVPTCGVAWIETLPPVVLEHWPPARRIRHDGLTTVGNWRAYGSIEHGGVFFGQKAHSLREFLPLPRLTRATFFLALDIHPDEKPDLDALERHGWRLVDPHAVAGTPAAYRRFIRGSRAEFGIAKSGYVASRCGWFSDRSACYLASGRPVLAQETGFSDGLPTGEGLFAFQSIDDVLAGIDEISHDYERHARAARAIAEEQLDSDKVLPRLLERVSEKG